MKLKSIILIALILIPVAGWTQVSNPQIIIVSSDPSGAASCSFPWRWNALGSGSVWYPGSPSGGSCTWTQIGSGSGGTPGGSTGNAQFYGTGGVLSGAAGTYYCDGFATLTACVTAVETYAGNGNTGSDHAVTIELADKTYSTGGTPIVLQSGIHIHGVHPRMVDCGVNPDACGTQTPNGGSWIDCGAAQCFTAAGGASAGLNDISLDSVGFKNFTTIATFGTTSTVGLAWSRFQDIYAIGNATLNASDQGFIFYNPQHLRLDHVNIFNVNTCLSFIAAGSTGSVPGNSVVIDPYCWTYGKSVANGNSTEPGMLFKKNAGALNGINLITVIRPQVNTFSGDQTGDGIQINNASGITIIGSDVEGYLANGVHLVASAGNYVDIAQNNGTSQTTFAITVDSTSINNNFNSENPTTNASVDSAVVGSNTFFGVYSGSSTFTNQPNAFYNGRIYTTNHLTAGTVENALNLFGSYTNTTSGIKIMAAGNNGQYPQLQLCPQLDADCATQLYDYFGSFSGASGGSGHGWNWTGGVTGRDGFWFRNASGNVFAAFIETAYGGTLGTFAVTHDLLVGGGLGWYNGSFRAKFALPTITAARTYTVPDGAGSLPIPAALVTTAAASDNVAIQGATASSHCSLTSTNAAAATNIATTYISAKTANQITVTHTATSSMNYDILCTSN